MAVNKKDTVKWSERIANVFTRSADERNPSDNPNKTLMNGLLSFITGRSLSKNAFETCSAQAALLNPIVFRCTDKIGLAVQSVPWYAMAIDGHLGIKGMSEAKKKEEIASIESVLISPNDQMTGASLRYWLGTNIATYRRIVVKIGVHNSRPNAIYTLRRSMNLIKPVLDASGNISGYTYGPIGSEQTFPSFRSATKDPAVKYPAVSFGAELVYPTLDADIDSGNSPLGAMGGPIEIIKNLMLRAAETSSANPNIKHIITGNSLSEDLEEHVKNQFEDNKVGASESGNIITLFGVENFDIKTIDNSLSDIHTKIPSDDMARHIAGLFGVPIALLGTAASDSAKFANNYAESRQSFFEDTIIPGYLVPLEEMLTLALCRPGFCVKFDLDRIPALQNTRSNTAAQLKDVTFLTDNEKREIIGFPPKVDDKKEPQNANN